jgi:hypothetical protein
LDHISNSAWTRRNCHHCCFIFLSSQLPVDDEWIHTSMIQSRNMSLQFVQTMVLFSWNSLLRYSSATMLLRCFRSKCGCRVVEKAIFPAWTFHVPGDRLWLEGRSYRNFPKSVLLPVPS